MSIEFVYDYSNVQIYFIFGGSMVASLPESSSSIEESQESKELITEEYVELAVAMKMADRSSKTIRNWLKDGSIEGKKENPENPKSKWLIHRESLMAHLATSVEVDPPRRGGNGEGESEPVDVSKPIEIRSRVSEVQQEISKETHQKVCDELEQVKLHLEKFRLRILELEKLVAIGESRLEQKEEIIELLKSNQPNLEGIFANHERKVNDLQEQLAAREKQLSIVSFAYEQEAEKGFLARLFTTTPELKMLEMKDSK